MLKLPFTLAVKLPLVAITIKQYVAGDNSGESVTSISTISEFEDDVLVYRMCMLCVLSSQLLYVRYSIVHVELLPFCQFLNIHITVVEF